MQFSLSSLLWLTAMTAALIAVGQLCVQQFPDLIVVFLLLSVVGALVGLVLLVFSVFMAFSIWVSPHEDFHRVDNLNKCCRMFTAGIVSLSPFAYFLGLLVFDGSVRV